MRAAGICITDAGLRAVAQFEGRAAKLSQRRPRIAIEITPAGLAAMRDYELAASR